MNSETEVVIDLHRYPFSNNALSEIGHNKWVKSQWPLVYLIKNERKRLAYVGETANAYNRIKNHLANEQRLILDTITVIGSECFNKSATLDIESQLIQYLSAENTYQLQNGNSGLTFHNYYEKPFYREIFKDIWKRLKDENLVSKSIEEIENSNLFKYSPYKALSEDQKNSVIHILLRINNSSEKSIIIEGSSGTGKTILATYLMKILHESLPENDEIESFEGEQLTEYNLLVDFHNKFKDAKIGFVVPMGSLRKSLKGVFRSIGGLKSNMVISPSEVVKEHYDILIIDEAHRLARRKNIVNYKSFDETNAKLGLNNDGTQLDWILRSSKYQIFFYDEDQSVKPSDVTRDSFDILKKSSGNSIKLKSQMRVSAGNDYIKFVNRLLSCQSTEGISIPKNYEFRLFESFSDLYNKIQEKEEKHGLCRLISGYSWPWLSKNDKSIIDFTIDGISLQWNYTDKDWVNFANPKVEVGCIHTTQGYDLNYAGIIFGREISFNKTKNIIEINRESYYDINGKKGVLDDENLKNYILNIYKTLMFRAIKGTFIYVFDLNLREYIKSRIESF